MIGKIVRSREFEGTRIKFMQSTLETVRYSLAFQSEFLATFINNDVLELPRLKLATSSEGLTSQEKQQRWKAFKKAVFHSLFDQLYAIRIANLISLLTITQTGKRYFRNEVLLKGGSSPGEDMREESGAMPNLTDHLKQNFSGQTSSGNRSIEEEWNYLMQSKVQELNRQAQEVDQELAPKKHEDSQE